MALVLARPADATVYLAENPVPNPANTLRIFQLCVAVDTVFHVCALNTRQKLALLRQGINTIPKLQLLGTKQDDLFNKLKPSTSLPLNRGGCEFTIDAVTNLTALVLFYKDRKRFGQPLHPGAFGQAELNEYVERITEGDEKSDEEDDSITGAGKLNIHDFIEWNEALELELRQKKGVAGVPLYYVIQEALLPGHVFVDDEERRLYQTRQVGIEWRKDQKRVAQIILSYVQPTDAYEWIRHIPPADGHLIHQTLVAHFEGEYQSQTIQNAHATIAALEYRNQSIFPWETFSNRIAKSYGRLEKNGVVFPLLEQLRTVSQKIRTANITFNTLVKSALTYQPAANHDLKWYLSQVGTHVANELPLAAANRGNFRQNVSAYEASNGNGATNVEYVIEDVGDRQYCNGVDVTVCANTTLTNGQDCHMS
jgi:hypothetical protein